MSLVWTTVDRRPGARRRRAMPHVPSPWTRDLPCAAPTDLLVRAEAAYQAAVADPATAGPVAEAVAAEARRAGNVEAEVVALRAQAWSAVARAAGRGARPAAAQPGRSAGRGSRTRRATGRGPPRPIGSERGAGRHALGRTRPPAGPTVARRQGAAGAGAADRGHAPECGPDRRGRRDLPQGAEAARPPGRHPGQDVQQPRHDRGPPGPVRRGPGADRSGAGPGRGGRSVPDRHLRRERSLRARPGGPTPREPGPVRGGRASSYKIAGLPLGELHAEAADAMLDLRLLPEARVAADRALREFIESDVPLMRAEAQLRVARVALLAGDAAAATAESRRAVEDFRQQRRTGWAARSAVVGVEARIGAGTATHTDLLEVRRAAATLERLGLTVLAVDAHLTAGRTATLVGRDAWAKASFGRAHELARGSSVLTRLKGRLAAASARDPPGRARRGRAPLPARTGRPRPAPRPARVDRAARARLGPRRRARPAGAPRAAGDLVAGEGVRLDGTQPGDRPPLGAARRCGRFRRGVRAAARDDGGHRSRRR